MNDDQPVTMSTLLIVAVITLLAGLLSGAAAGALVARGISNDDDDAARVIVVTPTPSATEPVDVAAPARPARRGSPSAGDAPTPTPAVPIATPGTNPVASSIVELVERVNPAVVTVINKQDFSGFFNEGADL